METTYLSEWKLTYLAILGKKLWKTSVEKEEFIHSFRMRTICFSTASEWKLHIFPQLPNQNYIYFHSFRMETICLGSGILG